MKRSVKIAGWLFERSRIARTLFVVAVLPPLYVADGVRGAVRGWRDETSETAWRAGLDWARTGDAEHLPTIPTSDRPAVVRRQP